ncbi:MAG: hypothetical protein JWQ14_1819 [Adhaeribacter sp.]|jgi:hypothetical protein|nr:hypothetical protein [Adhaeribacter sp.]
MIKLTLKPGEAKKLNGNLAIEARNQLVNFYTG